MKKRFFLFIAICFSFFFSFVILFFVVETLFRTKHKGVKEGLKSYFKVEVPENEAGELTLMVVDDELGFRLNPNNININSLSMKNDEVIMPKPVGSKRVVILGDSVPFDGDPGFVEILRKKFVNSSIEIINASTPGYTTYQELIFLKKFILQIDPDIVILAYVVNDNHKFLHKFDANGGMLLTDEAANSLLINTYVDKILNKSFFINYLKIAIFNKKKEKQDQEFQYWWEGAIDFNTAWKDNTWPEFNKHIKEMNELLKKQNAVLLITIFPLEDQVYYDPEYLNFDYVVKPQQKVVLYSNKQNIPVLDLFTYFQKQNHLSLYEDGLHLSNNGHLLSAEVIEQFILENL